MSDGKSLRDKFWFGTWSQVKPCLSDEALSSTASLFSGFNQSLVDLSNIVEPSGDSGDFKNE